MALLLARFGLLMASALCVAMVLLGVTQLARAPLVFPDTLVPAALVAGGLWAIADAWRLSLRLRADRDWRRRREPAARRFEARPSDSQQALAVLLMVVIPLLLALAVVLRDDAMALLSSLLFAVLCTGALRMLTLLPQDGRPALAMHADGLEHAWLGLLPWSAIHAVSLAKHEQGGEGGDVFMLALEVTSPDQLEKRLPWIVRRFSRAPRLRGAAVGPVWLPLNGLDCDPRMAVAAAQKFLAASRHAAPTEPSRSPSRKPNTPRIVSGIWTAWPMTSAAMPSTNSIGPSRLPTWSGSLTSSSSSRPARTRRPMPPSTAPSCIKPSNNCSSSERTRLPRSSGCKASSGTSAISTSTPCARTRPWPWKNGPSISSCVTST